MTNSKSTIDVTVKAIDGDYLVLETIEDKKLIHFPLARIPRPLEMGLLLSLGLEVKDASITSFSSPIQGKQTSENLPKDNPKDDKEESMRRMLETIVN